VAEKLSYPGFYAGWGVTTDWTPRLGMKKWHWVHYTAPNENGLSVRTAGFVDTEEEAEVRARNG
jgi:hypothetical protein